MKEWASKGLKLKMNEFMEHGFDIAEIKEKSKNIEDAFDEKIKLEKRSKQYKATERYHFDNRNTEKAE